MEVASERLRAPTFDRIAVTSFFTVHSARPNSVAMSALVRPRQIDARIFLSNSQFTSGSGIALDMTGGLCNRCEIVKSHGGNGSSKGMAVTLSGDAVLRNALVHLCTVSVNNTRQGNVYVAF